MSNLKGILNINIILQIVISLVFLFAPLSDAFARAGCCSKHRGVAGCNTATGYLQCKDGTTSPSCTCQGTTTKPARRAVKTTNTTTVAPAVIPASKAGKGCCARHGGVAQCNISTGYFMCKDGTQSGSCKCT